MSRIWRNTAFCLLLLTLAAVPAAPLLALLVRPIVLDLTSSGSRANGAIEVVNDRNRPIAVEVKVNRMQLGERGAPVLKPNDGADFQIFPPIANIPAGGRQVIRIRWIGEPALAESQLYMFSTSELPVAEQPQQGAELQVLFAINSVVVVRPPQARPDLSIINVQRATDAEGQRGVDISFQNNGAGHAYAGTSQLTLRSNAGWSHVYRQQELGALGLGLVPPNSRRIMFLPVADLPAEGDLSGNIELLRSR